ncbi:AAA family ATPase [Candidatus Roizmanbacteria bacterium]|nr:AAA family ATPase [Candidatus Roizmanbacteria bacterium]
MEITIITGPPGAGKSTISKLYAQKQPNCVRIETDDMRHMVVSPHKAPWQGEEGNRQLKLGIRNTCLLTHEFIKEGFEVVIVDFLTEYTFPFYKESLEKYNLKIIQLTATFDELKKRFIQRGKSVTEEEFKMLYDMQKLFTHFDYLIDNTALSPEETVDQIMKVT